MSRHLPVEVAGVRYALAEVTRRLPTMRYSIRQIHLGFEMRDRDDQIGEREQNGDEKNDLPASVSVERWPVRDRRNLY